jgi:hypothetical protein
MIKGLGERRQSSEAAGKAETGGWSQENMSQVKFAGNVARTEVPMRSSAQMAAENQARLEVLAKMRAEVAKYAKSVNTIDVELNRTVNRKTEQMGGSAVRLDEGTQQAPKKRFGLFGRR